MGLLASIGRIAAFGSQFLHSDDDDSDSFISMPLCAASRPSTPPHPGCSLRSAPLVLLALLACSVRASLACYAGYAP